MKKYFVVAQMAFQEYFTYRLNFWLEVLGNFVVMLMTVALWYAIFEESQEGIIGGYHLNQMVTYLIGAGLLNSFILLSSQGDEINDDIHLGKFSSLIIKPMNIFYYWLTRDFCRKILTLGFGAISFVLILLFFQGWLLPPAGLVNLLLTFLFIIFAAGLHFLIFTAFALPAFWLERTWGERFVIRIIMELAMGSLIPLTLFPHFWSSLFQFLPFKFMAFVPMEIYLGKIGLDSIPWLLGQLVLWMVGFAFLGMVIYRRGIKYYSAVGG